MIDGLFRRRRGRASRIRRAVQRWLRIGNAGPRVLANSIPKSGTHLLARCLTQFPGMMDSGLHVETGTDLDVLRATLKQMPPGSFATGHLPFSHQVDELLRASGMIPTLIIRDPRDIVVSHFHYVTRRASHPLHHYYNALPDDAARLMASIRGVNSTTTIADRDLESIGERFRRYLGWQEHNCCILRFSNLVGPQGGGTRERQVKEIRRLAVHLGLELTDREVRRTAERIYFEKSTTFRRGMIGDWRNHFDNQHRAALNEAAGPILVDLGYEMSLDW